jgi:hypothetical protein
MFDYDGFPQLVVERNKIVRPEVVPPAARVEQQRVGTLLIALAPTVVRGWGLGVRQPVFWKGV